MKKYLFIIFLSLSSSLYGQDISLETQKYYVLANEMEPDSVCNLVYTVKNVSSTPQVVLLTEDDVNTMPLKTLIKRKLMRRYGDFSIAFFLWDGNVENHSAHVLVPEYFIKILSPDESLNITLTLQNEDDRIVSGYTYDGILIPQIVYLEGSTSVALREDGFTIYKGKQIPKEYKTVSVDKEIISTFYDKKRIGLVFRNDEKEKLYTMKVYNTDGELKFEKDFNIPYTNIRMSDGYILMFNTSQMGVLNSRGVEKYTGTVDGTINNFFKIGWNRYMLVLDSGVNVIKLS